MRRIAITAALLLTATLAPPASAATTTSYGPLSPTNDPAVTLTGTVTISGSSFTFTRDVGWTASGEHCATTQARLIGSSLTPTDFGRCGTLAGKLSTTTSGSPLPAGIDVRICSGNPIVESTCSPWTRVYTSPGGQPAPSGKDWALKSKRKLAAAKGKVSNGSLTAVLTDRTFDRKRCGWLLFAVTDKDGQHKGRIKACNASRSMSKSFPGLTTATVKVCSGTKRKPKRSTCRVRTL